MKRACIAVFVLLIANTALAENDNYVFARNYTLGDKFTYLLMSDDSINGVPNSTSIGEAEAKVELNPSGRPQELINWKSLVVDGKVTPKNAFEVPPYFMTLNGTDSIIAPKLDDLLAQVPEKMTGMVTDLLTYLVAISPQSGVAHVQQQGASWTNPENHIGKWLRKGGTQKGKDCTRVSFELLALTDKIANFRTSFLAPTAQCFEMNKTWMQAPIKSGIPNNFINVVKINNSYRVMWGFEQFVIDTWVDRNSGKILRATMENDLVVQMKESCDSNWENCAGEFPLQIHRSQRLQLR